MNYRVATLVEMFHVKHNHSYKITVAPEVTFTQGWNSKLLITSFTIPCISTFQHFD